MLALTLLFVAVAVMTLFLLVAHNPKPRTAILNGAALDFIPSGADMYSVFRSEEPPFHDALYDAVRPVVQADVDCTTVVDTCRRLYAQGVRIFVGMLESKLLLALAPFARTHPRALILSASSSVPRAGVLPKNVFRLYPNDRDLYYEVRKVIADRFGTAVNRAVLVNGSPGNVWTDAVGMVLQSMVRTGEGAANFTVTTTMTAAEEGGTPGEDTAYIYFGDKANFNLAEHFGVGADANILIMSGTGWTFEVTPTNNPYASNTVVTMDMVNDTKVMYAAMLRLHTTSVWAGYLLQALHLATELDSKWDGVASLTDACDALYGFGGHRVFNADHDGVATGAFTNAATGHCPNCFFSISWPSIPPVSDAFSFVEESFDEAVSVMSAILDAPITCGTQIAACSTAVAGGDAAGLKSACVPLLNPADNGSACVSLATGMSQACMQNMSLCGSGTTSACTAATTACTVDMLRQSAAVTAAAYIPFL